MLTDRIAFGPFDVDVKAGELRRDGVVIPVQDLPFRLLTALLEHPGEVVSRAQLTERLWGNETFVDAAAGLNTAVAKLRDALGDNADRPLYIETVPKRGYRFVGSISPVDATVVAQRASPAIARPKWRAAPIIAAVLAVIAVVGVAVYRLRSDRRQTRVAVILFDNETARPEVSRLSQGLTDATVFALTAQPKLAVIGNAAILRTARPFRDIVAVRDALQADYIVFGQVQTRDEMILVRSHLIRASDQAHVWVNVSQMTGGEAALQSEVAERIAAAVAARVR
jgi:DNA-binding winged helix-turn-helix (wHTH) protein/TolB-like protein